MTFLIAAAAAVVASCIRLALPSSKAVHMGFLALMFLGAALMWSVDGFASMMEGGPFVELADPETVADDLFLGLAVLAGGIIIWGAVNLVSRARAAKTV